MQLLYSLKTQLNYTLLFLQIGIQLLSNCELSLMQAAVKGTWQDISWIVIQGEKRLITYNMFSDSSNIAVSLP